MSERLKDIETPEKQANTEPHNEKPFNPIEQRLEWSVGLVNDEYKTKLWKELPEDIKTMLSKSLDWKSTEERDELLDDMIDIIQNDENADNEIKKYFEKIWVNKIALEANQSLKTREASFDTLSNSLTNIDQNWKDEKTNEILTRVSNLKQLIAGKDFTESFDTEIQSILAELKNNPQTLLEISLDLQTQDQKNGTHNYEAFRSSIISLDSSFTSLLPQLDTKAKLALWTDNLNNAKITDKQISQTTKDGFSTTASLDGTARTLSLANSKFKLNSSLDNDQQVQAEAEKITTTAKEQLEPLTNTLKQLEAIKNYLEQALNQNTDIKEVKENVKIFSPELYAKLWIESTNSIQNVQALTNAYIAKISAQKDETENKLKKDLDALTQKHKIALQEKQEKQKRVLNFLHTIWFDRIPQTILNLLIKTINTNPAKYWLSTQIDLENGILWFTTLTWNKELNAQNMKDFIRLSNCIMSWSAEYPAKYSNWNITFHTSERNAKEHIPANSIFNIEEFVNKNLWVDPTYKAIRNLSNFATPKENTN